MSAGDGFSATNTPGIGAKLACVKLNTQTPSPPRGAVPVNQGRTWEAFSFCSFRIEFGHGWDRPSYVARVYGKTPPAVNFLLTNGISNLTACRKKSPAVLGPSKGVVKGSPIRADINRARNCRSQFFSSSC